MTINKTKFKDYPNPVLDSGKSKSISLDSGNSVAPIKNIIKAGTVVSYVDNSGTKEMFVYKSGKVTEAVTAGTELKLDKEHSFGVGDNLFDSTTNGQILSIDETNADYDLITVDTNLTVAENEIVYSISAGDISAINGIGVVTEPVAFETNEIPVLAVSFNAVLNRDKLPNFWATNIDLNIKAIPVDK